jgi:pantothenate synthetase
VVRRSYALLAVHVGKARLIDNMLIESVGDELVAEL